MKALFKKIFYYGLYIVTALVACLCSLFLVLNFLNPAFSQTEEEPAKKPGFGAIFKTIAKEVKAVVAPMGQKSQNPDKASQPATPPPPSNYENPEQLKGRAIDTSATGPKGVSNSAQPSSAQNAGSPALQNTGNPASPQAGQALPKAQALPDSALNPQAKGASQPATASATKASTANPVNPAQSASSAQNAGSPVLQNTGNPASAQAGQALPKAQALPDSALNPQATGASSPAKASTANPANSAQPAGSAQNPGSSVLQNPGNPSSIQAGQVLPKAQALPDSALNPQATGSSSPVTTSPTKASTTNPGNPALPSSAQNPQATGSSQPATVSPTKASTANPANPSLPSSAQNAGSPALQNPANPASAQATKAVPSGPAQPGSVQSLQAPGSSPPATNPAQPGLAQNPSATAPTGQVRPVGQKSMPTDLSLQIKSDMSSFIYDPIDKKDPFEDPAAPEVGEDGKRKIPILPKTPPESYDLTEINLKGIIWDTENPKALFRLPDGGHFTLVKGDKIGRANGVIFEIRESEVVIVELQVLGKAAEKQEKTVIKIKKIDRLGLFD